MVARGAGTSLSGGALPTEDSVVLGLSRMNKVLNIDYPNRTATVKDCVKLTPRNINRIVWLPPTCAYKLVAAGRELPWWHPLVSGDPETVHEAGVSVRGKVGASEIDVPDRDLEDHIVSWPLKWPKGAR